MSKNNQPLPLLVPQHVTKWGVLTSFLILASSFVAYKYNYYLLAGLSVCLFITSAIHWHKMTAFGLIKILDVLFATVVLGLVTFYYIDDFKPEYKKIWNYTVIIMVSIFVFNWVITYFQIMSKNATIDLLIKCQKDYNYFSLEYTKPGTMPRELCYYYVTFVHLLFVHIIPSLTLMYCVIKSHSIKHGDNCP
jgi:hypothetical protein